MPGFARSHWLISIAAHAAVFAAAYFALTAARGPLLSSRTGAVGHGFSVQLSEPSSGGKASAPQQAQQRAVPSHAAAVAKPVRTRSTAPSFQVRESVPHFQLKSAAPSEAPAAAGAGTGTPQASVPQPGSGWGQVADAQERGWIGGNYVHPEYPSMSRRRREEGSVLIGLAIDRGVVSDAKVVQSSGYSALDEAALRAVRQWEFNSTLSTRYTQKVTFRLE